MSLRNFDTASGKEVTLPLSAFGCCGGGSGCPCARCQDDDEREAGAVTDGEGASAAEEELTLEEGSTAKFLSRRVAGFGSETAEATVSSGESITIGPAFGISEPVAVIGSAGQSRGSLLPPDSMNGVTLATCLVLEEAGSSSC